MVRGQPDKVVLADQVAQLDQSHLKDLLGHPAQVVHLVQWDQVVLADQVAQQVRVVQTAL